MPKGAVERIKLDDEKGREGRYHVRVKFIVANFEMTGKFVVGQSCLHQARASRAGLLCDDWRLALRAEVLSLKVTYRQVAGTVASERLHMAWGCPRKISAKRPRIGHGASP